MVWHVSSNNDVAALPWRWSLRAPFQQIDRHLMDYAARWSTAVIVQNREQASMLQDRFGRRDAHLIPNFHPAPSGSVEKPADRTTICWIANVKELKRPELFVRLARELKDLRGAEFVMIGAQQMAGPAWDDLSRQIAATKNLRYAGHMTMADVNALLARAQLLVNTSEFEGFPNTFIQAWMRAVPVISLDVNPDGVFDEGWAGSFAAGSYDRLRDAVRRLATDEALRRATGLRAADEAMRRYSLANLSRVIDVLDARSASAETSLT
jgi:glycosyltransferase involved in cell wall biosynthesis